MTQDNLWQHGELFMQDGFWKLIWHQESTDGDDLVERHWRKPAWIGPATGPSRMTREEAHQLARASFLSIAGPHWQAPQSRMTIREFVKIAFVPEHVVCKSLSGRLHYQAILKHVLTPEEVEGVFRAHGEKSQGILKAVPDWPYLSDLRLCDARPERVQRLISAAWERGYSAQTIKHIRNVVSSIFAHAQKKQWFTGDNPAAAVTLPEMARKEAHALTLAQAREVLDRMQYPEKEIALFTMLTNMNVAEICGLQWKFVNLGTAMSLVDDDPTPPLTIAVRRQWYRNQSSELERRSRRRNVPIPAALLPILTGLKGRTKFTQPDDYVLVSRAGTPIKENHVVSRRLKPIGAELRMPWLSWHVFRRTHPAAAYELGRQLLAGHEGRPPIPGDDGLGATLGLCPAKWCTATDRH